MVIRSITIFLAFVLAGLVLFENQTDADTGIFPYLMLAFLLPMFVYDFWRRRKAS
ncbi:hypothetical protein HUG15_16085 [Salicibibacter cibarius]|uniref:Uncharacterized protein n=1 Tax=Salicibibacter cibarius TaxID=2743000 RepID=A0A7T7CCI7_9BACI|nr:hypothetical protein [Salicibibacter cibarius]QQK76939.1 hypothetical protein HUG15_16085 [Salicibibacter cibarius]